MPSYIPGMYYFDPTYIFIIIGAVICMIASANVNRTFKKYSKRSNSRGMTGEQVALQILREAGIQDVSIECVSGDLTDHYDPRNKVLRLSDSVYGSTSVAAIGVAAHECGHAIQHQVGYVPIQIRNMIVPAVNIGSKLSWPIILMGFIFGITNLINIGIILFSFALLFQIITLPVEFNASRRALQILEGRGFLSGDEMRGAKSVLRAAAMTYVTAMISTLLQLVRLVLLFGRRSDD